jgi:hypothetical protein
MGHAAEAPIILLAQQQDQSQTSPAQRSPSSVTDSHPGDATLSRRPNIMSIVDREGRKVDVARSGTDEFWRRVQTDYAGTDQRRWKYVAMLTLREAAGWSVEQIGIVFDHPRGHVSRCLRSIKADLKRIWATSDLFDTHDDELDDGSDGNAGFSDPDHDRQRA